MNFWEYAACQDSTIDFTSPKKSDVDAALQVCGRCPVLASCRAWASTVDDPVSILGGETPAARRARQRLEARRRKDATT